MDPNSFLGVIGRLDPVTLAIAAAVGVEAVKGVGTVGEHLIADSYSTLKGLLVRKCGRQSEVVIAVEMVETRPDSEGRRQTLHEEIVAAKVDQNAEILQAAQALLEGINAQPGGHAHIQNIVGSYNAQADRGGIAQVHVNQPRERT